MNRTLHWFHADGRLLELTNLEKVLYPHAGYTKRQVLKYYAEIAPAILPHLEGRALTLRRFPNGVEETPFYEKRCPSYRPAWMGTVLRDDIDYCKIDSLPSLIWIVNLGAIELHPFLATEADPPQGAAEMVFDLDPGEGIGLTAVSEVALLIGRLLEKEGLASFPKHSGSKGIQLYVPLHSHSTFDETKDFSRRIAQRAETLKPKAITSKMAHAERTGRVYVDWAQNDRSKTTVCVYSLRGRAEPSVSLPLHWDEVRNLASGRTRGVNCSPEEAVRRFRKEGDLFAPVLKMRQNLPRMPRMRFAS